MNETVQIIAGITVLLLGGYFLGKSLFTQKDYYYSNEDIALYTLFGMTLMIALTLIASVITYLISIPFSNGG